MPKDAETSPGHATLDELSAYWRTASPRAAAERARRLGVRKVAGTYPWLSIWRAEGLAPPPRQHWEELKRPHKTVEDLAETLGRSARTARRRRHEKPDAEFPDPVEFGAHTRLWRAAQLSAWETGRRVPTYKQLADDRARTASPKPSDTRAAPAGEDCAAVFDPFAETAGCSARIPGKRSQ